MRTVHVSEITRNIKEMCIEANYTLSEDMRRVFSEAAEREQSPIGKKVFGQLAENLEIAESGK